MIKKAARTTFGKVLIFSFTGNLLIATGSKASLLFGIWILLWMSYIAV